MLAVIRTTDDKYYLNSEKYHSIKCLG